MEDVNEEEKEYPTRKTPNILRSLEERSRGVNSNKNGLRSDDLETAAEDAFVKKKFEEMVNCVLYVRSCCQDFVAEMRYAGNSQVNVSHGV